MKREGLEDILTRRGRGTPGNGLRLLGRVLGHEDLEDAPPEELSEEELAVMRARAEERAKRVPVYKMRVDDIRDIAHPAGEPPNDDSEVSSLDRPMLDHPDITIFWPMPWEAAETRRAA